MPGRGLGPTNFVMFGLTIPQPDFVQPSGPRKPEGVTVKPLVDLGDVAAAYVVAFQTQQSPFELAVVREALLRLLDARDFLGYQLARANGAISGVEFKKIAKRYLREPGKTDADQLREKVHVLTQLIGERVDSDTVAVAFHCHLDEAEAALRHVARELRAGLGTSGALPAEGK